MSPLETLGRLINGQTSTIRLTEDLRQALIAAAEASPENASIIEKMMTDLIYPDVIMLSAERLRAIYNASLKLKNPTKSDISTIASDLKKGAMRHNLTHHEWMKNAISFLERLSGNEKKVSDE